MRMTTTTDMKINFAVTTAAAQCQFQSSKHATSTASASSPICILYHGFCAPAISILCDSSIISIRRRKDFRSGSAAAVVDSLNFGSDSNDNIHHSSSSSATVAPPNDLFSTPTTATQQLQSPQRRRPLWEIRVGATPAVMRQFLLRQQCQPWMLTRCWWWWWWMEQGPYQLGTTTTATATTTISIPWWWCQQWTRGYYRRLHPHSLRLHQPHSIRVVFVF